MTKQQLVVVDAMFSWRVANLIRQYGFDVVHVSALGQIKHDDRLVWKFAEENSAILFTKDTDFLQISNATSSAKLLLYEGYNSKQSRIMQELKSILPPALQKLLLGATEVRIP